MRDPNLYIQVKEFCKDSVNFIAEQLVQLGDKVPTKIAEIFKIVDDHTTSQQQDVVTDWSLLVFHLEKNLQKLESYQKASSSLQTHKVFGSQINTLIGTSESRRRVEIDDILLHSLLATLLSKSKEAIFDEKQFDELYKKIEKYFYAKTLRYRYFAPISNFSMDQDRLELAPKFCIVKITKEEKEQLLSTSSAFHSVYPILVSKKYAVEFFADHIKVIGEKPKKEKNKLQPQQEASLWFRTACSALRLYKPGLIGFNHVWAIDTTWDFLGTQSISSNSGPTDYIGDHMNLNSNEIPEFLELWERYKKINKKNLKRILNAVSRLNFGAERNKFMDKLIDYYVGFESLFLNKTDSELKYRLSLSVAHWLGTDHVDRRKIYKVISKGYDQRSIIVHGGEPEKTIEIDDIDIPFEEHIKLVENYLRSAIKKFIIECVDNNANEDQLIEQLRDKVLE